MKIVFVCTGNIFRSFSAEYCAKKLAKEKGINLEISSAGTTARPTQQPDVKTVETLKSLGISDINHKQTRLSEDIIKKNDVIIAMGTDHKEFIKEKFGIDVPLFNEIAYGRTDGVLDIHEKIENWLENRDATENHIAETVHYIYESMPKILEKIKEK